MDYYQPYSLLKIHSTAPQTMQICTRIFVPGNQNLKVTVTSVAGSTTYKIYATLSNFEHESRVIEVTEELSWGGSGHTIYTEVYDLANNCIGKNALHTNGATPY